MHPVKTAVLLAFVGATTLLVGCGDDSATCGPGTALDQDGVCLPTSPDAGDEPDAEQDPPDAAPTDADVTPSVAATIAITDTTVSDPVAALVGGVRGGAIRISFGDLTMQGGHHGGAVLFSGGDGAPIGSCLVQRFDAEHQPLHRLDAGTITISGPATGTSALLKTVGACSFQPVFGDPNPYGCILQQPPVATVSGLDLNALSPGSGLVAYTLSSPATLDLGMTAPAAISTAARAGNVVSVPQPPHTATPPGSS